MRVITSEKIKNTVADLCMQANCVLKKEVLSLLKKAKSRETKKNARKILEAIIKNARIAKKEKLAICQDTGMPVVFIKLGQGVKITGDLTNAVNKGIESGYKRGYFRKSVIKDPLLRGGPGYSPVIIDTQITKGDGLRITVLPKGFGCENKSCLKMFNPTVELSQIRDFVIGAVKNAGADACPPYIVGVGIGGTADYACLLAKKALLKSSASAGSVRKLERELFTGINKLKIGPMGLGGRSTCLAVKVLTYPTHIAGLPVAVNLSCHALRSAAKTL